MYRLLFALICGTALAPAAGIHFEPYSGDRAYGLAVIPPWPAGGRLIVDFPEHLDARDAAGRNIKILHYYETQKLIRWQVALDGLSARLDLQSPFTAGIWIRAQARVAGPEKIEFSFAIENGSGRTLRWIEPLFCHRYGELTGFPARAPAGSAAFSTFDHVYAFVKGQLLPFSSIPVPERQSRVRGAEVSGSPQPANPFATDLGGVPGDPVDAAITGLTSEDGKRSLILAWTPGKTFLSNAEIPCVHADPFFGTVPPGQSARAQGLLIMTEKPLQPIMLELRREGHGVRAASRASQ